MPPCRAGVARWQRGPRWLRRRRGWSNRRRCYSKGGVRRDEGRLEIVARPDDIAGAQDAAAEDLGAQPAAVQQPLLDAGSSELLQVVARRAQPRAARHRVADGDLPAEEVVEGHAARHEVAPGLGGLQRDAVLAGQRLQGLALDERDLAVRRARLAERAGLLEVAVARHPLPRHGLDALDGLQLRPLRVPDADGDQTALKHERLR